MDSANQGNCWVNDEIIRRAHKIDKIPIQCQICKSFMTKSKDEHFCFIAPEDGFSVGCEEFKLGKWALVDFLEEKFGKKIGGKK